jgi:hypothetical protein
MGLLVRKVKTDQSLSERFISSVVLSREIEENKEQSTDVNKRKSLNKERTFFLHLLLVSSCCCVDLHGVVHTYTSSDVHH